MVVVVVGVVVVVRVGVMHMLTIVLLGCLVLLLRMVKV